MDVYFVLLYYLVMMKFENVKFYVFMLSQENISIK